MKNELVIVKTADGSNTIYNPQVGENYHSKHGALQESRHVFLNSGLKYFLDNNESELPGNKQLPSISILEVGFGTGLNFLLTADYCIQNHLSLNYTGIEAYPLDPTLIKQTGYNQYSSPELWAAFTEKYTEALSARPELDANCRLQIAVCKLLDFEQDNQFDVIYYDAFAAVHQPEMWDETAVAHTIKFLKPGGVFVTYAITGNLKRSLRALNCKVEKAPGAPGKREMLRAVKLR